MSTMTTRIACGLAAAVVVLAGCSATSAPAEINSVPLAQS